MPGSMESAVIVRLLSIPQMQNQQSTAKLGFSFIQTFHQGNRLFQDFLRVLALLQRQNGSSEHLFNSIESYITLISFLFSEANRNIHHLSVHHQGTPASTCSSFNKSAHNLERSFSLRLGRSIPRIDCVDVRLLRKKKLKQKHLPSK